MDRHLRPPGDLGRSSQKLMSATWEAVFDTSSKEDGASPELILEFQRTALQPLSAEEIAEVNGSQRNPFPSTDPLYSAYKRFDAQDWVMPSFGFPNSYLSFLRWSNGGMFTKGGREFGFFPAINATCGVRSMMLAYHIPEYMKYAVPFAFDGAGTFYFFDMREPPVNDEFPIVLSHAGSLGWEEDDYERLAESFVQALNNANP